MPEYGLKRLDEICQRDQVHKIVVLEAGQLRELTIEDYYSLIECVGVGPNVPNDIQDHFETARNLFLYSWFVYRFTPVAESHAYASVEFAIRERASQAGLKAPRGLRPLLEFAISQRWIVDGGFRRYKEANAELRESLAEQGRMLPEATDDQAYTRSLCETLSYFRNDLAHGSVNLAAPGAALTALRTCADIINQLFPPNE